MKKKELNNLVDNNKGVLFVCRYCGDLFWSFEERDKHRVTCEDRKIINLNIQR